MTPEDAAAFWKLEILRPEELQPLAMRWLEEGLDGIELADLALEDSPRPLMREVSPRFEKLLAEQGLLIPSTEEALRIAMRYWLRSILQGEIEPYQGASQIVYGLLPVAEKCREDVVCQPVGSGEKGTRRFGDKLGVHNLYVYCVQFEDLGLNIKLENSIDSERFKKAEEFNKLIREEATLLLQALEEG